MEFRIESDFEVDLKRIDEGHQPRQQLLVDGMVVVGFEGGAIGELHYASKLVSLRSRRDVVADESFDEAGDLTLKSPDLPDDVLFLQLKQARRSVVARYVHGDSARHAHQGQRVVEYQQALQTVSDPLLGWTTIDGLSYYVRQFRDMKGAIPIDDITPGALNDYARILGQLLAKGHARTSGASMIAGYVGSSTRLDTAIKQFARAYADQVEADYDALVRAVSRGVLPIETT